MKNIAIIGSTGSIGTQAIDIIDENQEYNIFALSAGKNLSKLSDQVHKYKPKYYDKIWSLLRFSMRSKGISENYPDCKNVASIRKWTKKRDGKYKGALHIRYK